MKINLEPSKAVNADLDKEQTEINELIGPIFLSRMYQISCHDCFMIVKGKQTAIV